MVLFDHNGCMRKYEDELAIMREFFDLRLEFYNKRKKYLEGILEAEALRLSNQAR
jgi:DNA topoisomerase-2